MRYDEAGDLGNPGEPEGGRRSLVPLVKKKAPSVSNETECMPKENEVDQEMLGAAAENESGQAPSKRSAVKRFPRISWGDFATAAHLPRRARSTRA